MYAEVQLQVHIGSESVKTEVQVHTDTERVYAEVQLQVHTDSERVYACLAITCHLHFWHNDKTCYCGDTGEDRVLMCSNAFKCFQVCLAASHP